MEVTSNPVEQPCVLVVDPMQFRRAGVQSLLTPWADASRVQIMSVDPAAPEAQQVMASRCEMALVSLGAIPFDDPAPQKWVKQLHAAAPNVPIVVFSDREDTNDIVVAFQTGVCGFIPTNTDPPIVLNALTFIINGGHFFPPAALRHVSSRSSSLNDFERRLPVDPDDRARGLTIRQQQVFDLLRLGKSNKVIARELNMYEATVKVHVRQIMRKLGVSNRTQAALVGAFDPMRAEAAPEDPDVSLGGGPFYPVFKSEAPPKPELKRLQRRMQRIPV